MMSGTRANQIKEYREFLEINSIINYKHGPIHYRRPDTIIAKMIRQMLPFDRKPSGKTAYARLRTYIGAPNDTKPIEKIQFEKALIKREASNYTSLAEICRVIGWTE
jgi:large subunit ribosomal protein L13